MGVHYSPSSCLQMLFLGENRFWISIFVQNFKRFDIGPPSSFRLIATLLKSQSRSEIITASHLNVKRYTVLSTITVFSTLDICRARYRPMLSPVCLSVRPSHEWMSQKLINEDKIMQFSPYIIFIPLVFCRLSFIQKFWRFSPERGGGRQTRVNGKQAIF